MFIWYIIALSNFVVLANHIGVLAIWVVLGQGSIDRAPLKTLRPFKPEYSWHKTTPKSNRNKNKVSIQGEYFSESFKASPKHVLLKLEQELKDRGFRRLSRAAGATTITIWWQRPPNAEERKYTRDPETVVFMPNIKVVSAKDPGKAASGWVTVQYTAVRRTTK